MLNQLQFAPALFASAPFRLMWRSSPTLTRSIGPIFWKLRNGFYSQLLILSIRPELHWPSRPRLSTSQTTQRTTRPVDLPIPEQHPPRAWLRDGRATVSLIDLSLSSGGP